MGGFSVLRAPVRYLMITCRVHASVISQKHNEVSYTCRTRLETRSCVGKVAYFVKCTWANDAARDAGTALGISLGTHRFAIVDAWTVEDVQLGIEEADWEAEWAKEAAKALQKACVVRMGPDFRTMLKSVRECASVFAMSTDSAVKLKHAQGKGGTLSRLAVPVSSLYYEYYGRPPPSDSNWAVHPVVRVDKRKVSLRLDVGESRDSQLSKAIKSIRGRTQYFVHTYSKSNSTL